MILICKRGISWFRDEEQTVCGDSPQKSSSGGDEDWEFATVELPNVPNEEISNEDDLLAMMQTDTARRETRLELNHQVRLANDLLYKAVALSSDSNLLMVPQGGTTKIWLLPAEGAGPHDTVVRVELRPQVPDWTDWICDSWRDQPQDIRFVVMTDRPLPISPKRNDLLILGASARDTERGL